MPTDLSEGYDRTRPASPATIPSSPLRRGPTTTDELPPQFRNEPFVLQHNARNWTVVDGEWVPTLRLRVVVPGLFGTDKNYNTDLMVASAMRNGFTLIDPDDARLPGGSYLRERPCLNGGKHHHCSWEEPQRIDQTRLPTKIDRAAHRAFAVALVKLGIIAPPSEPVKRLILTRLGDRHRRSLKRTDEAMRDRNDRSATLLDDAESARNPGEPASKKKGLISGNASDDRARCGASDDTEALWAVARGASPFVTVRRAAIKRLGQLGEDTRSVEA